MILQMSPKKPLASSLIDCDCTIHSVSLNCSLSCFFRNCSYTAFPETDRTEKTRDNFLFYFEPYAKYSLQISHTYLYSAWYTLCLHLSPAKPDDFRAERKILHTLHNLPYPHSTAFYNIGSAGMLPKRKPYCFPAPDSLQVHRRIDAQKLQPKPSVRQQFGINHIILIQNIMDIQKCPYLKIKVQDFFTFVTVRVFLASTAPTLP